MEAGRVIGELLMVEENTLDRKNLIMGRVLVLTPARKCCPEEIRVVNSRMMVSLEVEMDTVPVTVSWVEETLGGKGESSHQKMEGIRGSNIVMDLGLISVPNGPKPSNFCLGQSSELSSGDKSGKKDHGSGGSNPKSKEEGSQDFNLQKEVRSKGTEMREVSDSNSRLDEEEVVVIPTPVPATKRKGRNCCHSSKIHDMQTRSLKSLDVSTQSEILASSKKGEVIINKDDSLEDIEMVVVDT
ncbi:hypothetical protein QYF36_012790 [Acer negundo]|nr:hypothetical protein QYF36_012790 [Acer negundo]